jgi:hypothetical protein
MTPSATPCETSGKLTYFDQPAQPAAVTMIRYDQNQRVVRAVLALGACWGLAVLAVVIPILHFLLVPVLFLAGPFFAYRRLHEEATVTGVRGTCPACAQEIAHTAKEAWRPLMRFDCEHCHRRVTLESTIGPAERA